MEKTLPATFWSRRELMMNLWSLQAWEYSWPGRPEGRPMPVLPCFVRYF